MPKYRKKPVVIEALQWTGENHREMFEFLGGTINEYISAEGKNFYIAHSKVEGGLIIKTLEGRGWIETIGHREVPGRPALYATTKKFLDDLSLRTLEELPPLEELGSLVDSTDKQEALPIEEPVT